MVASVIPLTPTCHVPHAARNMLCQSVVMFIYSVSVLFVALRKYPSNHLRKDIYRSAVWWITLPKPLTTQLWAITTPLWRHLCEALTIGNRRTVVSLAINANFCLNLFWGGCPVHLVVKPSHQIGIVRHWRCERGYHCTTIRSDNSSLIKNNGTDHVPFAKTVAIRFTR